MKKSYATQWVLFLAIIGILSMGGMALADGGKGGGHPCWSDAKRGDCGGCQGEGGPRWAADLSDEQIDKIKTERKAFRDATQDLRQSIRQKRLELKAELAKQTPDATKAGALQKELSDHKAQMAQKRLEHILKIKAIAPDADHWFSAKGHKGGRGESGRGQGCGRW